MREKKLKQDLKEYSELFALQHKALLEAQYYWQEQTGNNDTFPDLLSMLVFLMDKIIEGETREKSYLKNTWVVDNYGIDLKEYRIKNERLKKLLGLILKKTGKIEITQQEMFNYNGRILMYETNLLSRVYYSEENPSPQDVGGQSNNAKN